MFKWTAEPLKNVNGIKFGMSRKEVREIIGRIYFEFKKTKFSKTTSDNFEICHVFYNTQDEFEAIEIFDEVYVTIEGKQIFPTDIAVLAELSEDFIKEDDFYIHCAGGYRSVIAASILKSRGYHNVIDVKGGYTAIKNTGIKRTNFVCPSTLKS